MASFVMGTLDSEEPRYICCSVYLEHYLYAVWHTANELDAPRRTSITHGSPSWALRVADDPARTCICREKRVPKNRVLLAGKGDHHHAWRRQFEQRDRFHYGGHAAEIRSRRLRGGWLGVETDGCRAGDAGLRSWHREGEHNGPYRRVDRSRRHRGRGMGPLASRADGRLVPGCG